MAVAPFNMIINERCLRATRAAIIQHLGALTDLDQELANTIANVCYRYFLKDQSSLPQDLFSVDQSFAAAAELDSALRDYQLVLQVVPKLREMRRQGAHASLINVMSDFVLSVLKYKVEDAANKSPLRLKLDRLLNRHKVQEIPYLFSALKL